MVDTIDPRYDSVNRSTAKARNESILLNIVRASRNVPLNFVVFSRVTGLSSSNVSVGLPSFFVGPLTGVPLPSPQRAFLFSSSSLGSSSTASNSFDITPLESKDFYLALLRPVDLPTLNFFIRQGYSRELLFWLFTESVRETTMGGTVEFLNDPEESKSCQMVRGVERCFRDMVDVATATGLTVETKVEGSGKKGGGNRTVARLCFDPVLAARAKRDYDREIFRFLLSPLPGHRPRCRADPWEPSPGTDTLTFKLLGTPFGPVKYEIITRSTFGIYQFLGRILALQLQDEVNLRGPLKEPEDRRILSVHRGEGGCFAEVTFESESVCVPRHGAENTKRIFSLLAQLIALYTQAADLAITPTVRVLPQQ